jgi:hypothetical protein
MDSSALFAKLNNLENSWSSLDAWLKFWIVLVVIGVSIELIVVVKEYRDDRNEWARGIIRPPDRPSRWLLFWSLLGAGLVAIGVAGELAIHLKAGKVETDIRSVTRQLVAVANAEASKADARAAEADLRRVQLQAMVAWRYLSSQQQKLICSIVSPKLADGIGVISSSQDPEEWRYAQDFSVALRDCSASIGLHRSGGVGNRFWAQKPIFGVWLVSGEKSNNGPLSLNRRKVLARTLLDALRKVGVIIDGIPTGGVPDVGGGHTEPSTGVLDIYIRPRPPPTSAP